MLRPIKLPGTGILTRARFIDLGGDDSGSQTSTVTNQTILSPEQKQILQMIMPIARQTLANPPRYYPGKTVAPFDPLQIESQKQAVATARQGALPNLVSSAGNALQFSLGDVLLPSSNPALQSTIDAATRPITRNFQQIVLPGINAEATLANQFGSSRHGVAQGIASQDYLRQIGDTSAQIATEGYNQGLQAMGRGLALAPQIGQMQLLPAQVLEAVGAQQQTQAQALIDDAVSRFMYNEMAPFLTAQDVAALAFGVPGSRVQSSATQPVNQPSPWMTALGGAATGASLGSIFGGVGGPVGAVLGGLFGLLS